MKSQNVLPPSKHEYYFEEQQSMQELESLKSRLASDNVHLDMKTMKAGLTYPYDFIDVSPKDKSRKSYAAPSTQLMVNPFKAAPAKGKKKRH